LQLCDRKFCSNSLYFALFKNLFELKKNNTLMRSLLTLLFSIFITIQVHAQLVLTIAGQLDSIGSVNGPALQAHFNNPHGIAVDGSGNIYVADRFGHQIRKITPAGMVSTLAGSGNQGTANGQGTNAEFNEPWGLCADSIGNVYVADTRNNKIRKIDINGNVTTIAGTGNFGSSNGAALSSTFGNPTGIEIDQNTGIIYVADHLTHIIRKIDPNGNVSTLAGTAFLTGTANGQGAAARFNRPYGLELDNNGDIIVADEWNHLIRRVTPTGLVTTIAGSGTTGSQDGTGAGAMFNYPWDIAVDENDDIYVADGFNNTIRKITPAGVVTTYVGTAGVSGSNDGTGPSASFNGATGIAYYSGTDELFVADAYNELVRKIINLNIQSVSLQLIVGTSTVICEGETIGFKAVPEIYDNYEFFIGGISVQNSASENFTTNNLTPGNYLLSVTATAANGNIIPSSNVFIQVLAAPNITITTVGNTSFFEGDSVTLIASAGSAYLWNTGATTGAITVFNAGNYWLDLTNSNGCTGRSDTITVAVTQFSSTPTIEIVDGAISISQDGSLGTVCYGSAASLRSSYNTNNQWFKDGFPISGATARNYAVSESGQYQVEVIDTLGFTLFSNTIEIIVLPKQINDFTATPVNTKPNQTVQFTSNVSANVANYFWNFGDTNSAASNFSTQINPTHTYADVGIYTVTLITAAIIGCSDTLTKVNYINISESGSGGGNIGTNDGAIFIPSAFTPNGDNSNDIFYVRGADIDDLQMSIYNQWGERIFFSNSQSNGWEGTYNGLEVQIGTYVYIVNITMTDGTKQTLKGHITLLR
jgi:gliding motility-associated-like protein